MRLSWSHKLFLRINDQVGKRRWLDLFMIFCARWLIYVSILYIGWYIWFSFVYFSYPDWLDWRVLYEVFSLLTGLFFLLITSRVIGWLWPHRRPSVELPHIKQLVQPLSTWKSFPSDHTGVAFYFAFLFVFPALGIEFYQITNWLFSDLVHPLFFYIHGGILFGIAVAIAVSRIYVGVHYPRDIIGGIVSAAIFAWFAALLNWYITHQLLYLLII